MDKNPINVSVNLNGVINDVVHCSPKISKEIIGSELYEVNNCTEKLSRAVISEEEQGMVGVMCADIGSASKITKEFSSAIPDVGAKIDQSPESSKKSQVSSPAISTPPLCGYKKYGDEEDDSSVSSSNVASSGRSSRFKVTVATAPTFMCTERAENRKEFYSRLEEKRQALEEERNRAEARAKEEQEAAIKQLRKNMNYRANPIPSFYNVGPPPKIELNKAPVTRAVSPKLGRRRRSCSDVHKSPPNDEGRVKGLHERGNACGPSVAPQRHSTGAPFKPQLRARKSGWHF